MHELHETCDAHLSMFISISFRHGLVGTGLLVRVNQVDIFSSYRMVRDDETLNPHYAQLGVVPRGSFIRRDYAFPNIDVTMESKH